MPQTPVSQRAIARKLGVSQATVSMALAGNPHVAEETRRLVLAAADELSYRPDPGLRSLARYRHAVKAPQFHATIAWAHNWPSEDAWSNSAYFGAVHAAAAARATQLGYKLENVWLNADTLRPQRLNQILASRGIRGVLLVPPSSPERPLPQLDWADLCPVRLLSHGPAPSALHTTDTDHSANLRVTVRKLLARGYRRPGLITAQSIETRLDRSYASAYLGLQTTPGHPGWPPILWFEGLTKSSFAAWLKSHQPDVLILSYVLESYGQIFTWLHELGLKIPADLGAAMLCLPDPSRSRPPHLPADISGIDEGVEQIGIRSLEFLVHLLESFTHGEDAMPIRHLVAGTWHEGTSLRPPADR